MDLNLFQDALSDIQEALQNVPAHNKQDRRILTILRDEIASRNDGAGTSKGPDITRSCLRASVDTLTEL